MKVYKRGICLAMTIAVMAGGFVGCDSDKSGGSKEEGQSSMEECAKADGITLYEGDIDGYLNLVPEELIEYWEDKYFVTREQIRERVTGWYRPKDEDVVQQQIKEIEQAEMDNHSYEYQLDDIQEVNKYYFGGVLEADEIHYVNLSNDTDDSVCDCHVFKYDGKWYSLSAVKSITDALD